jgi:hypothetical protein
MKKKHQNSIYSLCGEIETGRIGLRAKTILAKAFKARRAFTDREMMLWCGSSDPNLVRPRITELRERGLLADCGATVCGFTGKTVRLSRVRGAQEYKTWAAAMAEETKRRKKALERQPELFTAQS